MHARVYYNGRVIEASRARISAVSPASIYGHGVFTTIAIRYGQPFLWHHHWARLSHNADQLRIDTSQLSDQALHQSLAKLIKANNVHDGRARITLLARHVSGPWRIKGMKLEGCDVLILSGDSRNLPDEGITLTVSPYRLS